jgi:hypothetical protein
MKKIVVLVIFVFIGQNSLAQDKISLGVNGGATYSSFRGNPSAEDFNAGVDFLAGFSFEYKLKERLSLVVNLNYDRKSASKNFLDEFILGPDDPNLISDVKVKLKMQFISLPILVRYKFGNKNDFYINGGPFISYLLKSELSNDYDNTSLDMTKSFKKIDYGLVLGFGKTFKLKNNTELSVEIRENLGLNNISSKPVVDDGSIKTNSLNLICNYSFNL